MTRTIATNSGDSLARRPAALRNLFWLGSGTVVATLLNMATNFLLARNLGVEAFGAWSVILSTASWITVLRTAVGSDLIRRSASDRQYGSAIFIPAMLALLFGSAVLGGVGLLSNLALLQQDSVLIPSICVTIATSMLALMIVPASLFAGRDRMQWQFSDTANSFLLLAALLALLGPSFSIRTAGYAYLIASFLVSIPVLIGAAWIIKPIRRIKDWASRRDFLVGSGQLFLTNWLYLLHVSLDLYLLQILAGALNVGVYNAALKLIVTLATLPLMLFMSMTPELTRRAAVSDYAYVRRIWLAAARSFTVLAGGIVVFILITADDLIGLGYGASYSDSGVVLRLLSFAVLPRFLQVVSQSVLFAAGKYTALNWGFGLGVLLQVVGCAFLIPMYGPRGAAISFFIAECAILCFFTAAAFRTFGRPLLSPLFRVLIWIVGTVGVTTLCVMLKLSGLAVVCPVILFSAVLCYGLGCISNGDIQWGRSVWLQVFGGRSGT